ncbi:ABC transporter permease [Cellulomonas cellasea]|uniref:ABC transporter permease n=2 Tax=Cellulomonas cellasea TaxID=43670 RepID=A0A0A0B8V9_9CELL|nr:ABC transporter permease [Cellulomonas cellasea]KGM02633.1 ABC transporter permease [Cellulomonas cellasea DSM 20118]GEA88337.1 ABC transporter permease [Cellulomonas cellasea]
MPSTLSPRTDPAAAPPVVPAAEDTVAFADPPTLGRRPALAADRDATPTLARRVRALLGRVLRSSIVLVLFLALWEVAPRVGLVDAVFLPPLSRVLDAFGTLASSGELALHLGASLSRAGTGFAIAVLAAIPLGVAIGWYERVSDVLSPFLELFRNTAALALLPVFILILGIGETSKIALVVYACTFPVLLTTISAVRSVDPLLVKSARSLGLSSLRLFQKVVLPAAVPTVFTGVRMAGASSILVLIAAEMVGAKAGLGYLITYTQFNFQIEKMYAGIIAIALVGVSVNGVLLALERHFSRWRTASS